MRACLLVLLLACGNDDRPRRYKEIDATRFHEMLANKDESANIETIHVESRGHDTARYVITFKNTSGKSIANAEYPGKLLDEIRAAGIPYSVKPADD